MSDNRKWAIVIEKNVIKKFAIKARRELLSRVSQRALRYGISDQEVGNPNDDSVGGHLLSSTEKSQRAALIKQIQEKGYEQVMEEVAYTWFNRFSALRFMEVNGYLPARVRVFTDENNAFKPQILTEAIHMELDGLDMEKVYAYKEANDNDELYKYLLITQCNALNSVLPGMFQRIADYTELLFPDNLLREGSVVQQMVTLIPEDDWKDAVQIIGWLYQYYNSEKKDDVFAALKKNVKITKENIPAATQLFTPDWIVRYMVENSLGRLWIEGHPNDELKGQWKYYLEEAEQEPEVQAQLDAIREEYKALKPEDIQCIDPCSGSGHILAYMFDVLVQIYEAYGVDTRTAVTSIVENNLYGLDIDDRAAQLSYFAVMMKACQYDKRFLRRKVQPHVYAIVESNHVDPNVVDYFCNGDAKLKEAMDTIISELHDAKEYGSILTVTPQDWSALYDRFAEIKGDIHISRETALRELLPLVQTAQALAQKYDAVVTNPPYLSNGNMSSKLSEFVKKEYPDTKSDLCTCFIEKSLSQCRKNGFSSLITMESWMSLSSFKNMRSLILDNKCIVTMVHMPYLGKGGTSLGINFGTSATVIRNVTLHNYTATFDRVIYTDCDEMGTPLSFPVLNEYYNTTNTENFNTIPGSPLTAYYATEALFSAFSKGKYISDIATPASGTSTGDNDMFLRLWHEVPYANITFNAKNGSIPSGRWFPCNKGGAYRRWAGGGEYVIDWEDDGRRVKQCPKAFLRNVGSIFKPGLTWSKLGSGAFSIRAFPDGYICESIGCCLFEKNEDLMLILALLNSKVAAKLLSIINPSMGRQPGYIGAVPFIMPDKFRLQIRNLTEECVQMSQTDWNSFEASWDFFVHPLVLGSYVPDLNGSHKANVAQSYTKWEQVCEERFNQLKANEEELNRIFIDIYGLQDELSPEVEDKDVTVRKADLDRDIRSFISYAVGCMFGRYSLYKPGLIYAGGDWDSVYGDFPIEKISLNENVAHGTGFHTYGAPIVDKAVVYLKEPTEMQDAEEFWGVDADNIIPISDDEYFEDDIVGRFVEFVRIVYGTETLDENLQFIADALGGKGTPKEVIRNYFLTKFYADHCKMYQKRPIYWLFDSGKKNGFKCLIYMHRYQPDTIARIRTDYVHEQQARYRTAIADLEQRIANAATGERVKLNKQLKKLNDQAAEILAYEEKIHHLADQMIPIDLDDGVKVNYAKFQDVLAKIK